jgi:hypothetical protein
LASEAQGGELPWQYSVNHCLDAVFWRAPAWSAAPRRQGGDSGQPLPAVIAAFGAVQKYRLQ